MVFGSSSGDIVVVLVVVLSSRVGTVNEVLVAVVVVSLWDLGALEQLVEVLVLDVSLKNDHQCFSVDVEIYTDHLWNILQNVPSCDNCHQDVCSNIYPVFDKHHFY